MRRLYYTLLVLLPVAALGALAARWVQPRPRPALAADPPGTGWHLLDPEGVLLPFLPLPSALRAPIRSLHLAGDRSGPLLIEAQTRLPAWILHRVPLPGFSPARSSWDLCLFRGEPAVLPDAKVPSTLTGNGGVAVWLTGSPPVEAVLKGSNPFEFSSFCPGEAEEDDLPGPSEGATLYLAAARSPHLERLFPGLAVGHLEAGPDWADAAVMEGTRRREMRWGAPGGPPGASRRLSLRLRYRDDAQGVPGLLRKVLPEGALPGIVGRIDAECRAEEGGERCEGRLTLTF